MSTTVRYTGRQFDSETGLYYYRARYYDPNLGRFMSEDPIGFRGGTNFYSYVQSNPIDATDPSGEGGAVIPYTPLPPPSDQTSTWQWFIRNMLESMRTSLPTPLECPISPGAGGTGTALARLLGQAGEDAVGITGPKVGIEIPGSGITRFPDELTNTTLTEVKNVQNSSFTQQLRDYLSYAQQNGLQFNLYVRPTTTLSGPLQNAVSSGQINLYFIPLP